MSKIILYTPGTGFPDLEAKIAYGLCRIGIEAGYTFSLTPLHGSYKIEYNNCNPKTLTKTFLTLLERILTSQKFFDLGVKAKDRKKYPANKNIINRLKINLNKKQLSSLFNLRNLSNFNFKKDMFCGHSEFNKFGGSSGLILLSSFHAGKPYSRNKISDKFNLNLCEVCAYLAVLGLFSFCFNINIDKGKSRKYVIIIPLSKKELSTDDFIKFLSLQKTLHNFWLSNIQPLRTLTISLLSKVPSICDLAYDLQLYFHLSLLSKDNRGDTVIEQTAFVNTIPFSKFISKSPYNSATVTKLLGSSNDAPKVKTLIKLTEILESDNTNNLNKFSQLCEFARIYTTETSTENYVNLLYPEVAEYLLKEVAMIEEKFFENQAIKSLAETLRYFIKERKYSYADEIRNATKESKTFEETIAKMLREGELRRVQQEEEKKRGKEIKNRIFLPNEREITEVFKLAEEDFEKTKLSLIILAFSFPAGEKENE